MDFVTPTLYYVIRCPGKYTRDLYVTGKKETHEKSWPIELYNEPARTLSYTHTIDENGQ